MEELIRQLLEDAMEAKGKRVFVGEVQGDLLKKFRKMHRERDRMKEDIKLRVKQLELELKRKIEAEFEEQKEQLEEAHKEIWKETYQVFNLDPSEKYVFSEEKDVIYQHVKEEENPFAIIKKRRQNPFA